MENFIFLGVEAAPSPISICSVLPGTFSLSAVSYPRLGELQSERGGQGDQGAQVYQREKQFFPNCAPVLS